MSPEYMNIAKEITIAIINKGTGEEVDIRNIADYSDQVCQLFLSICDAVDKGSRNKF